MGPGTLGIALTNLLLLEPLGIRRAGAIEPFSTDSADSLGVFVQSTPMISTACLRSMIEPSLDMMAGALFELIALARVHEYTEAQSWRCRTATITCD